MPDTNLRQPSLRPLRAAAEAAELAQAASGLAGAYGGRLVGSDPLAPLARDTARSMIEAGLPLHYCARHDPRCRPGGVCLLPVPAGPAHGRAGIAVSRATHSLMSPDRDRAGTCTRIQQAMNTAIGGILCTFGYPPEPFGSGAAWLVTGHRGQDPGADR